MQAAEDFHRPSLTAGFLYKELHVQEKLLLKKNHYTATCF